MNPPQSQGARGIHLQQGFALDWLRVFFIRYLKKASTRIKWEFSASEV